MPPQLAVEDAVSSNIYKTSDARACGLRALFVKIGASPGCVLLLLLLLQILVHIRVKNQYDDPSREGGTVCTYWCASLAC